MAPISDETASKLQEMVDKLEARVKDLESRISQGGAASSKPKDEVRMVIMGPPGAGLYSNAHIA